MKSSSPFSQGHPTPPSSVKQTFASFGHRNYRVWFMGQSASMVGTWMQITALGFFVFELTHSPAFLGYVGFASGVPFWMLTLFGGVVSDRMQRRHLLLITQTAMMILAFILAALTFLDRIEPWHIVVLAFGVGVANAFDTPARHAFVVELVERENLSNAIALNSIMMNLATAIGPSIAGVTYAILGPGWCFMINGVSFIAVISALLMIQLKPQPLRTLKGTAFEDLKEGLHYIVSHPVIRILIVVVMVTTLFGMSFVTLMPAWAVNVLRGDSKTNGFLQSARGVGSLIGGLTNASFSRTKIRGKLLTMGSLLLPVLLLLWSAIRWLSLSLILLIGIGWALMLAINIANMLIQSHVSDSLRGRVMSTYTVSIFGMLPLGSLLYGTMAQRIGEPSTVILGSIVLLAFTGILWLRMPRLRSLE
jgi:predicted MFS family arabinose efflux permease